MFTWSSDDTFSTKAAITIRLTRKLLFSPDLINHVQREATDKAHRLREAVCRADAKIKRDNERYKRAQKRARRQQLRQERADRLEHKEMLQAILNEGILELIKERKLTITAKYMKSIKDPDFKRKIVEAVCLGKVSGGAK